MGTQRIIERIFDPASLVKADNRTEHALPSASFTLNTLGRMAWPAVIETVLIALINIVNTIMVGGLGHEAIAAVGLTTQPRMIVLALFTSLNVGVTALVARRKGEGRRDVANQILRQAMFITAILAIVLSALSVVFAEPIIRMMGANDDTLRMSVEYLQIMMGGIFFNIMSLVITAAQRGAGNTKISMRTNLVANIINIAICWLLVEGRFGLPALGVRGAALATCIGYFVAFWMALFSVLRHPDEFLHLSFRESFIPKMEQMSPILRVGSSSAVEQVFIRIGFFVFTRVAAELGTVPMATHQIGNNLMMFCYSFGEGLMIANASIVGQSLGAKRPDLAVIYGRTCQRLGLIMAGVIMTVMLILRGQIIVPFSQEPEIISLGTKLIYLLIILSPGQISQVLYSSSLRVGGDNRFVAVVTALSLIFGRTILSWLFCFPFGLGLVGAWLGFVIDQYARLIIFSLRYRRGKWTQIAL